MASPYGHALVGLGLLNLCYPRWRTGGWKSSWIAGSVILGACSPDLDFIPGFLQGNLSRFHHGHFHSLGMAMLLSLVVGLLMIVWRKRGMFWRTTGFVFLLVLSHLILDYFTEDLKPPFGFPFFWPFSETYYLSPWGILPYVDRDFSSPTFWNQNIRILVVESLFFLPFFFLTWKIGNGRRKS